MTITIEDYVTHLDHIDQLIGEIDTDLATGEIDTVQADYLLEERAELVAQAGRVQQNLAAAVQFV